MTTSPLILVPFDDSDPAARAFDHALALSRRHGADVHLVHAVPARERLLLELPGGGGYGDPHQRDPSRVADDVRLGLVSPDTARHEYGVVVDRSGAVDETATEALRGER